MKLTVVGGGSTYTPELVDGLRPAARRPAGRRAGARRPGRRPARAGRRRVAADPGRPWATRRGSPRRPTSTPGVDGRRRRAAPAARRRAGARNERRDLAARVRLRRAGDDGAGGLAKALRTVPVVLDIAERVRRTNPDAWIVDFTNPVGIVTRALLQEGHRAIGLCNVAIGFQRRFAAMLGVAPERVSLDHVGLNHLTWERAVPRRRRRRAAEAARRPRRRDRRRHRAARRRC